MITVKSPAFARPPPPPRGLTLIGALTSEVDLICLSRNSHLKGFCDEWPKVKRIINRKIQ